MIWAEDAVSLNLSNLPPTFVPTKPPLHKPNTRNNKQMGAALYHIFPLLHYLLFSTTIASSFLPHFLSLISFFLLQTRLREKTEIEEMPPRGYVLIFAFWALLALITPTLIFWSASAKPNLGFREEARREMKARRMMASLETGHLKNRSEPVTFRAPSPSPLPMMGNETLR